jgi:hypothetical protein
VVHNQTGVFVTSKSNKLERTSAKIDLDYAFNRYLAVLTTKLDAIALNFQTCNEKRRIFIVVFIGAGLYRLKRTVTL